MFPDLGQDLQLVQSRLGVRLLASLDLHRAVLVCLLVVHQPHGRKVAPSQLLNHHVFLVELFAQHDRVVAIRAVVYVILALRLVLVLIILLLGHNGGNCI